MRSKGAVFCLLSVLVALQGAAMTPISQENDAVPLKNWTAAPYWAPEPSQVQAETPSVAPAALMPYVSIRPCRLVDTRVGFSLDPGPWGPPMIPQSTQASSPSLDRSIVATATAHCPGIPAGARAIAASLTTINYAAEGRLLAYAADEVTHPQTANVNFRLTPSSSGSVPLSQSYAIVPMDATGAFRVFTTQATDLVIDVNGYYAPALMGTLIPFTATGVDYSYYGGSTVYVGPHASSHSEDVYVPFAAGCIATAISVKTSGNPGGFGASPARTWTFTLRAAGVNTSLACTIQPATTTCSATGALAVINAGELVNLVWTKSSTASSPSGDVWATIRCQ